MNRLPAAVPRLAVDVPATADGLAQAQAQVEAFLRGYSVTPRALGRLLLVLEEAVMNVVMHGHDAPGPHRLALMLDVLPATLALRLEDSGRPFDPRSAVAPPRPATLEEARPGGMGLHLLRSFARSVAYERLNGRNVLTLQVDRA